MRHYFYHGFEPLCGYYNEAIIYMLNIIKSGEIKRRNEVNGIEGLNHICLYRKKRGV